MTVQNRPIINVFPTRIAAHRLRLGSLGEQLAADFLERRGLKILDRNVRIGRGEVDLIATDGKSRFVVEVKTGLETPDDHPRWNFTDRKADQVLSMARRLGMRRVDLVTVAVREDGIRIDWSPRVI
ncbi:MAG: YraN family protein [bacterium]|nr:YraN family protein [bacterium]MXX63768.1 hypothetical protein [Acidimicrobiia bacterium]MCY3580856.1 YraN family protein [bacterium]MCY3653046.1 YraN family protein [bacterium]MDE0644421.1 YraN family protein [bacterium]